MKLDSDLQQINKINWSQFAVRQFDFLWTYIHFKEGYMKWYPKFIKMRLQHCVAEGKGIDWIMYRDKKENQCFIDQLSDKSQDKKFLRSFMNKVKVAYTNYGKDMKKLAQEDFSAKSNRNLIKAFQTYQKIYPQFGAGASTCISVSEGAGKILEKQLIAKGIAEPQKLLLFLSSPIKVTLPMQKEIKFIKLVLKLKKHRDWQKLDSDLQKKIPDHYLNYCWVDIYSTNSPVSFADFKNEVKQAVNRKDLQSKLVELQSYQKKVNQKINYYIQKYSLDKELINLIRRGIYYRISDEAYLGLSNWVTQKLFLEIGKRLSLTVSEIRLLTPQEIIANLKDKSLNFKKTIKQREKHYLIAFGPKKLHIFSGKDVEKFLSQMKIEKPNLAETKSLELKGTPACEGMAKGRVKVVLELDKIKEFREGNILVVSSTTPNFVPAMKKAAAIVTDEGGITCHAAIVSRELGVPCVIGTKIATKVLKNGDLVEVDANKGIIKKLT